MTASDSPQLRLLVLGGTSALALAYVRQRLATLKQQGHNLQLILVARDSVKLAAEQADLSGRGAQVETLELDLNVSEIPGQIQDMILTMGGLDEVILAYGSLSDQDRAQGDAAYLTRELAINFSSTTVWLEFLAQTFGNQGQGRALIIGSVAGDRGRQSNYVYGAAKAGLATYVGGMAHRFAGQAQISFTLLKPGQFISPMTDHLEPKGWVWAQPEQVAKAAEAAVLRRRSVVYHSWFWWAVMQVIRLLPNFVFQRSKL